MRTAVQLVAYDKTDTLAPGESQTLEIEVNGYFLASYDTYGAGTDILSAGDYYLAIGDDSHDALNNILAAKGYTTGDSIFFTAEPAETTEGSAYSLTVRMANADGKIVSTGGFGGASEMAPGVGTLELYPDGTFLLTITGSETDETQEETQAVGVDGSPMPKGFGGGGNSGVGSFTVNGTWKETSGGQVKLSYDLSTAVSTAPDQGGGFFPS